jgi:hypothetical protein
MASDCAIAASLALQYGCPADVLRKALSRDSHGRANGPLGAALDQIFQASSHGCDKGEAPAIRRQHEEP